MKLRRMLALLATGAFATVCANASLITLTVNASGAIPSFASPPDPNTSSTSANQFDRVGTNATIQSTCGVGFTCSALTLTKIDFTLTANSTGELDIVNANPTEKTIAKIISTPYSIIGAADLVVTDALGIKNANAIPAFAINGPIAVDPGTTHFSGTGTDTQTGTINALTGAWSNSQGFSGSKSTSLIDNLYVGTGIVTFTLKLSGTSAIGSTSTGVTTANNIETINNGTLNVLYTYTYDRTEVSGVPEPYTFGLLGAGLVACGMIRRRRNNA